MKRLLSELSRRHVFRVAIAYLVTGWVLLQVGSLLFENFGAPEWVTRVFTVLIVLGFPLALVLAWAFELTPEGVVRDQDSRSKVSEKGRFYWSASDLLILMMLVVLVSVSFFRPVSDQDSVPESVVELKGESSDQRVSVAVLPFVNMSSDQEQEYFSDGITEEILNSLAAIKDLRVTSRTSSFAFKNTNTDVPTIAGTLGVSYILEGSVRKHDDMVRITAQLIDVKQDAHLWSDTYDKKLTEIFRIQEEISEAIAATLKIKLLGAEQDSGGQANPQSYDHFLRGQQYLARSGFADIDKAIEQFSAAVALEDGHADAYAGLATAYGFSVVTGKAAPEPNITLAENAAYQALRIDKNNPYAQAALGSIELVKKNLYAAMDRYGRAHRGKGLRGMDLYLYISILIDAGEKENAKKMLQDYLELDPLNPDIHFSFGLINEAFDDGKASMKSYEKAVELFPENPNYRVWRAVNLATVHADPVTAIEQALIAIQHDPKDPELLGYLSLILFSVEDYERSWKVLDKALSMDNKNSFVRDLKAQYFAVQGKRKAGVVIAREEFARKAAFRHGSLRGSLTLLRDDAIKNNHSDFTATMDLYLGSSKALKFFPMTHHLRSVASVSGTPAMFLAVDLSWLYKADGKMEQSLSLTQWVRRNLSKGLYGSLPGAQLVVAEALAIEGKKDEALMAIEQLVADRFILGWQWRLRDNLHFHAMEEQERYKDALAKMKSIAARARQEIEKKGAGLPSFMKMNEQVN